MPVMEEKLLMTAMDLDEKNYERLAILDRNQKTRHSEQIMIEDMEDSDLPSWLTEFDDEKTH